MHRSFYLVEEKKTTDYQGSKNKCFLKLVTFLFIFLNMTYLQAAGPRLHAYLGLRWIEKYAPEFNADEKREFILGTLFPDIRYLVDMSRKQTHLDIRTMQQVEKGQSAFDKGMRFHSYVDYKRSQFYRRHKIYASTRNLPKKHRETFVKLVEDEIIYFQAKKEDWDIVKSYLMRTTKEEEDWVDKTALAKWHLGLTFYFNMAPSTLFSQIGFFNQDILIFDAETIREWGDTVKTAAEDPKYQTYLQDLIDSFAL